MRPVKLHFVESNHLIALLADNDFIVNVNYLNPSKISDNHIVFFDPITHHTALDTEMVVLSKCASAIKRVIFPDTSFTVEFLNPILGQQKGGLIHNDLVIIDSTDIERVAINITVRQF